MLVKSEQIILEDKVLCEDHVDKYIEEWRGLTTIKLKQIDSSHKANKLGIDLCEDCGSLGFVSITLIETGEIIKREERKRLSPALLRCDDCGCFFYYQSDLNSHQEVCNWECDCPRHTGQTPIAEWTIKDFFMKLGIKLK